MCMCVILCVLCMCLIILCTVTKWRRIVNDEEEESEEEDWEEEEEVEEEEVEEEAGEVMEAEDSKEDEQLWQPPSTPLPPAVAAVSPVQEVPLPGGNGGEGAPPVRRTLKQGIFVNLLVTDQQITSHFLKKSEPIASTMDQMSLSLLSVKGEMVG